MVRQAALKTLIRWLDRSRIWCESALAMETGAPFATAANCGPAGIARSSNVAILEPRIVESLKRSAKRRGGDAISSLTGYFRHDAVSRVASMNRALEAGDAEGLRRAAHTLTWTSINIGATELSECCKHLEQAARERGIDPVIERPLVMRIEDRLRDVLAALDTELLDNAA